MTDGDRETPVIAAEPIANDAAGGGDSGEDRPGRPHGTVGREDAGDEAAVDAADADEAGTGEGVTFFEGGDGREEARTDIERGA